MKNIDIIKKKDLPENAIIKGFTFLKDSNEDKQDFASVINGNEVECFYPKRKSFAYTKGYTKIDGTENDYLEVKSRFLLLLLLFLFLLIITSTLIFKSCYQEKEKPPQNINIIGDEWDGELPGNNDKTPLTTSIEIPGYSLLWVSADEPNITLINPEGNDVYFKYTISEDDKVIIDTDYLKPNSQIEVDLYKQLSGTGEHKLQFLISTYDVETLSDCNGAIQDVTVKVY